MSQTPKVQPKTTPLTDDNEANTSPQNNSASGSIADAVVDETPVNDAADANPVQITETEPDIFIRKSKNSKYIIEYHRDACIGAVTCAEVAPETFVMDDDNKATLVAQTTAEDSDDLILAAAQSCPVLAIIIKDAETGEQIFPPL